MKSAVIPLLAALIIPSTAFAETARVHALIGEEQMSVKATALEVIWSSNLENIQVDDQSISGSGTFMLRCGDDGSQYVMISVPVSSDVWPSQSEDLHAKADVTAFGSDLEMTDVDLLSMKAGRERLIYVALGNKASEFARHWGSGMAVRVATHPGNGLNDLRFIVGAPVPNADSREKMAKVIALCQMLAR